MVMVLAPPRHRRRSRRQRDQAPLLLGPGLGCASEGVAAGTRLLTRCDPPRALRTPWSRLSGTSTAPRQARCRPAASKNVRAEWGHGLHRSQPPQARTQADTVCSIGEGRCPRLKRPGGATIPGIACSIPSTAWSRPVPHDNLDRMLGACPIRRGGRFRREFDSAKPAIGSRVFFCNHRRGHR